MTPRYPPGLLGSFLRLLVVCVVAVSVCFLFRLIIAMFR